MTLAPVTAVIPTVGRPEQLQAAVSSVLDQTTPPAQLVVIIDGPDPKSGPSLEAMLAARSTDPTQIRVLQNRISTGPGATRNRGVDEATQPFVAFLDDDDTWHQTKLEHQLDHVGPAATDFVSSHAVLRRAPDGTTAIVGQREPIPNESIAEFLFCRNRIGQAKGQLLTPTLLAPTDVLRRIPFDADLRVHEDWDLLLRLGRQATPLRYVPVPLATWNIRSSARPISEGSTVLNLDHEIQWANDRRDLLGSRAYSGFLLNVAMDRLRPGDIAGAIKLHRLASQGQTSLPERAGSLPALLLPERLRDTLARRLSR